MPCVCQHKLLPAALLCALSPAVAVPLPWLRETEAGKVGDKQCASTAITNSCWGCCVTARETRA